MASNPAPSALQPGIDIGLGQFERLLVVADVLDRRAAAARARDIHDLDAVPRQQPHRRLVDLRRQHLLAAARHQRDAPAALADGGKGLRPVDRRGVRHDRRHRVDHRLDPTQEGRAARIAAARRQQRRQRLGEPAQHDGPAEQARPRHQHGRATGAGSGRPTAAYRCPRCDAGRDRPDACSSRPTGRSSCRTGTTGSDRRGAPPGASARDCPRASP